jgi:calcineurin-like phosphoesterase family protein
MKLFNFIKFVIFVYTQKYKHRNRTTPITWFTSDLHYGHHNVLDYCNRPFWSAHQMNKWITRYWNAVVKPFDTIYVLGDFSINPKHHPKYLP